MNQPPPFGLIPSSILVTATLLCYDYLCTFEHEVAYIWPQPLTIGSVLFFLNRYSPFIDTFLNISLTFTDISPEDCLVQYQVVIWLVFWGMVFSEAILLLRTYAIWERRRSILIFFMTMVVAFISLGGRHGHLDVRPRSTSGNIGFLTLMVSVVGPRPFGERGCDLVDADNIIFITFVLLALCEFMLTIGNTLSSTVGTSAAGSAFPNMQ
ncbi:hypothetical protein D9758_010481 [Tetrapyrgos nigripes]|uniref:DUF6533 domain-containing protein n=1 Tax=Tetrapyrgos nigripes TaxID=182062 RepID=A0A8H5D1A9_9AGAR|nr:hypothetical protein D9758_010481 [Tetrapyrgos nigripes]